MDSPAAVGDESDSLADVFFSQDSLAPRELDAVGPSDAFGAAPAAAPRAMVAALSMLGGSLVALGIFLLYSRVWMPTPVEVGQTFGATLPEPVAAQTAHGALPEPAPAPFSPLARPPQPTGTTGELGLAATASHVAPASPGQEPRSPAVPPRAVPERPDRPDRPARADAIRRAGHAAASGIDALIKSAYRSLNGGDARRALSKAQRALDQNPARADAWIALGSAYDTLHDRPRALRAFRSCEQRATGPYVAQCRALARR